MDKLYKQYAAVSSQIKFLEEERDALKESVIERLKDEPEGRKELEEIGSFTLSSRKAWVYTDKVKGLEEKIKLEKDKEQKKGLAKATITEYVLFKSNV